MEIKAVYPVAEIKYKGEWYLRLSSVAWYILGGSRHWTPISADDTEGLEKQYQKSQQKHGWLSAEG